MTIRQQLKNELDNSEKIELSVSENNTYYKGGEWVVHSFEEIDRVGFYISFMVVANGTYTCQYSIDEPDEYENVLLSSSIVNVDVYLNDKEIALTDKNKEWIKEYIVKNIIIINL